MSTTFEDGFTGTAGTSVGGRTATTISGGTAQSGKTWSPKTGGANSDLVIDSGGRFRPQVSAAQMLASQVPVSADYASQIDLLYRAGGATNSNIGCTVRADAADANFYQLRLNDNAGSVAYQLVKVLAGSGALIGSPQSVSLSTGDIVTLKLSVATSGSNAVVTCQASINGGAFSTLFGGAYTDTSPIASAGKAGIRSDGANADGVGIAGDNFQLIETASSTVSGVTVSPSTANVAGGGTQQFAATVAGSGSPSQAVTWAASAGSINSSGLFTAPAATSSVQTITVTATSTQDTSKSGTATVTVAALSDTTPPTVISRAVPANGASVLLTMSEPVGGAVNLGDFAVSVAGANRAISSATLTDSTHIALTLSSLVNSGETVLLSYTGTAIHDLSSNANALATFSNAAVANSSQAVGGVLPNNTIRLDVSPGIFGSGLTGNIFYAVYDSANTVKVARTASGVSEFPSGSSAYSVVVGLTIAAGDYLVFDDGTTFATQSLTPPVSVTDVANAILDQANGIETSETMRQTLRLLRAVAAGKAADSGGNSVFKRKDNTTTALTVAHDASGNRTSSTVGTL